MFLAYDFLNVIDIVKLKGNCRVNLGKLIQTKWEGRKSERRKSLPSGFGPDFADRSSVALRPGVDNLFPHSYFVEWNSFNRYYTILDGRPGKSKLLLTGLSNWTQRQSEKRTRVNVFSLLPILLCFPHSLISTLFNAFHLVFFFSFSFRIDLAYCWPFGSKVVSKIFAHSRVCRCSPSVVPTSDKRRMKCDIKNKLIRELQIKFKRQLCKTE